MLVQQGISRRIIVLGAPSVALAGCFDKPCHERNEQQRAFLGELQSLAKKARASNNPLQIEEAARQSVALSEKVGPFRDWCGTLRAVEGNAQNVAVTIEIGPQVSLYAFNDWTLATAGTLATFFSTRSRETPPPGLSDQAVAALKTLRLGERVKLAGRMGEIAGSGLFDLVRLFGKSDAEHRQFLQAPRFVGRIEALAPEKSK